MERTAIEDDLERTLGRIAKLATAASGSAVLIEVAALLTGFVERHRSELTFESFPLPTGADEALCSYELHSADATGLTLYLNAIRGGVDSVVHDHGTWAVIVAIAGEERNRIYRHFGDSSSLDRVMLELEREIIVREGQPLVLEEGQFHSIHTAAGEPALQLHLYGRPIDTINGRRIVDLQTGQLVYLESAGS